MEKKSFVQRHCGVNGWPTGWLSDVSVAEEVDGMGKQALWQKLGGKSGRLLCTLFSSLDFAFLKHSKIFFGENVFNKYLQRSFMWHSLD